MDTLLHMRAFRRIVELGGLARAADDLQVSSAGLSKQLRTLEAHLGVVLLQRTTRRMGLTDTGRAYYAECCRLLDEVDALEKSVREQTQRVAGRLRVNAPQSFALATLAPLLAEFMALHPALELDLAMEDRLVDAVGQGFDVSIRLSAALADSSLIARRLASLSQLLCAAPDYLRRRGMPSSAAQLREHDLLAYSLAHEPGVWPVPEEAAPEAAPRIRANNSLMLRELLIAGLGIGALPSFLARPAIAAGQLVRIQLPDAAEPPRHVYAVYPTHRHLQPKVKAFVDFLAERLPAAVGAD
ncbi:LysR family transcriptional regulator [Roseateles sp. DAIF2]|uniref:LysR family transcriptional regulator n=1 Tax=Roseateles sp. DAIF2 TaxID=2714952 RepID=UPI0018A26ABD|nr:LysR family transcriptional regulator [Roseateles sp. DAIF2]QPF73879.1 LysR family transcriptional regulator [Roseateles sp. DAIF2]